MSHDTKTAYAIGNMDCANCAKEVELGVARLDGVQSVRVDFATARMTVAGAVDFGVLQQRVQALGKTIQLEDTENEKTPEPLTPGGIAGFVQYLLRQSETRMALVGAMMTLTTVLMTLLGLEATPAEMLYTAAMMVAVYPIAQSGLSSLRINRHFSINLLMTIAAFGAVLLGEYLEAFTVIFLFAIGEAMEGYTADRARNGLRELFALKPSEALRMKDGAEETVHVNQLHINDLIRVKPGERIPMDGVIVDGESGVDQSPVTGESIPVHRESGDSVYAGTINGEGSLTIRVTHLAADNTLSRMIELVQEAQATRSPTQRVIDQFADLYTPAVIAIAMLVALVPPLFFGAPFTSSADETGWLYRALTMLVIACPCALVISTPVTVISAITAAARHGVLIKGGLHLEALGTVDTIAFDKTGTLTQGKPAVTHFRSVDCISQPGCDPCVDMLTLAAAVERGSTHPLATAVVSAAEKYPQTANYDAQGVRSLSGRGVSGIVNGRTVTIGSHALFDAQFPHNNDFCRMMDETERSGSTVMAVHDGDRVRGMIAVADKPRPESKKTVEQLHNLGLNTVMLTGDNATVADAIGKNIGVSEVQANMLPDDKLKAVRKYEADGRRVAMIGDGINDTPALAAATVGIAMGGAGSAQAMETADIALMSDDVTALPYAVKLARFTRHLIRLNIALTFAVKLVFLALAAIGMTTMWVAVFADMGMSLLVTLNGMRPIRMKA